MRRQLIVSLLGAVVGCGDNLHPEEDQLTAVGGDQAEETTGGDDTSARPITARFVHDPNDCDDHSVRLTAIVDYLDDGSSVENPICQYTFEDGTQHFGCFVVHSLPTAQNVVLTVRDPVGGAVARYEQILQGPASFDATFDVRSDGMSIVWDVQTNYGGTPDVGGLQVFIEPSDKVIVSPPDTSPFQGSVQVTEAGTYTVFLNAFISFADEGGCSRFFERTIEIACHHGDGRMH